MEAGMLCLSSHQTYACLAVLDFVQNGKVFIPVSRMEVPVPSLQQRRLMRVHTSPGDENCFGGDVWSCAGDLNDRLQAN